MVLPHIYLGKYGLWFYKYKYVPFDSLISSLLIIASHESLDIAVSYIYYF
jgi:hypothetical protein